LLDSLHFLLWQFQRLCEDKGNQHARPGCALPRCTDSTAAQAESLSSMSTDRKLFNGIPISNIVSPQNQPSYRMQ